MYKKKSVHSEKSVHIEYTGSTNQYTFLNQYILNILAVQISTISTRAQPCISLLPSVEIMKA